MKIHTSVWSRQQEQQVKSPGRYLSSLRENKEDNTASGETVHRPAGEKDRALGRGGPCHISYLWKGLGVHFGYDDWALYALQQRSEMI